MAFKYDELEKATQTHFLGKAFSNSPGEIIKKEIVAIVHDYDIVLGKVKEINGRRDLNIHFAKNGDLLKEGDTFYIYKNGYWHEATRTTISGVYVSFKEQPKIPQKEMVL